MLNHMDSAPKQVPKNNVQPVLVDVKKPNFNYRASPKFGKINLGRRIDVSRDRKTPALGRVFKTAFLAGALLFVFGGVGFFVGLNDIKSELSGRADIITVGFAESLDAIKGFETEKAGSSLRFTKNELVEVNQILGKGPNKFIFGALSAVIPTLKEATGFLKGLTALNVDLIKLADLLTDIKINGFRYFTSDGETLIKKLEEIRELVQESASRLLSMRNQSKGLKDQPYFGRVDKFIENYYVGYGAELYTLDEFLESLIALLDSDEDHRILLMFQNSSEIRPTGGFTGSYGELVVKKGEMQELVVQDIYWPDHPINFERKIIPPEPLRYVTEHWGARDANWFFDFPTSAKAVIELLESSKIYKEAGAKFDGVIAINVGVLESILRVVGEIPVEEYNLTIDADNFLPELQREIESGRDNKPGNNPKKILSVIAPEILSRLSNLSQSEAKKLMDRVGEHIEKKDIQFYSPDSKIARFLNRFGLDGSIYELPSSFWGVYLGVVNANIAGGKTDVFINQTIDLWVDIALDGSVVSDLNIRRVHNGGKEKDPWYNTINKNYIKVFTNPGSDLIFAEGYDARRQVIVDSGDYEEYPALKAISDSRVFLQNYNAWTTKEFGKNVFGGWFNTPAGKENKLNLRYANPSPDESVVSKGKKFQFVFDRQSGVNTDLKLTLSAPLGYIWEESKSPTYVYEDDDPKRRIVLELSLVKQ